MLWLRSLLCLFGFIVISVIITPIMLLITLPVPKRAYRKVSQAWAKLILNWLTVSVGVRYRIVGEENLCALEEKPHLIISNHQSTLETYLYTIILPPHVFVLKRELLWIPFFGWGLAKVSPIAINRKDGRNAFKSIVKQAKERFKEELSIIIFPEGTRSSSESDTPYKRGGFLLAKELKANILPLAINSGLSWPKGRFLKYPGTITLEIGKPISSKDKKTTELLEETELWIRNHTRSSLD